MTIFSRFSSRINFEPDCARFWDNFWSVDFATKKERTFFARCKSCANSKVLLRLEEKKSLLLFVPTQSATCFSAFPSRRSANKWPASCHRISRNVFVRLSLAKERQMSKFGQRQCVFLVFPLAGRPAGQTSATRMQLSRWSSKIARQWMSSAGQQVEDASPSSLALRCCRHADNGRRHSGKPINFILVIFVAFCLEPTEGLAN